MPRPGVIFLSTTHYPLIVKDHRQPFCPHQGIETQSL
jgi:hypothetical protein